MSIAFMVAACIFALVLGCVVACVDRWREARLAASRVRPVAGVDTRVEPIRPTERRAA